MKFEKPDKRNVFKNIFRNIQDSHHGLVLMAKESSTVQRLIPIEIIAAIAIGIATGFVALEYIILAAAMLLLFTTETINSAIEETCDLVTEDYNERVKRAKDMASGSVWLWHLVYVICLLGFAICHLLNFVWWAHIIPAA